jgi:DEAD/DEAH box helicase domain-containing protein
LVPFRTFGFVQGVNRAYLDANRLENLILVCRSCHRRIESAVRTRGALDGLAYALHNLAPLYLMCDRQDLDSHITRAELTATDGGEATVVIFERTAAGLGFSERLFELHDTLLRAVRDNIQSCPCNNGCPACVGPVLEGHSQLETKRLTLALVNVLMSAD